jgi:ABC-2 type transport system permease protein
MERLRAITIKEIWALLRDPRSRLVLFVPPLLQLFLFTFAATLDVKNVDVGVLDMSAGVHSAEFVSRLEGSPNFRRIERFRTPDALRAAVERQEVIAGLVFEADFDRRVETGRPATIGAILDGRRSNAAQIVASYLQQVATQVGADLNASPREPPETVVVTNWFNPNLDFIWFNLPGLLVIIVSVSGMAITAQSVARERELGTFDQLLVSPLRAHEILIGKMVPAMLIGLANGTLYLIVGSLVFGVPFTGSLTLFYLSLTVYLFALIGLGMFVSSISQTQQQAFLGSFLAFVPLTMLSGFASPIENMPGWLQVANHMNPAQYFMIIVHGLFLKAMPASAVLSQLWPIAIIACVTLSVSAWLFRARME